jgi:glycosyltransferase involved in cell wall biosynthesis
LNVVLSFGDLSRPGGYRTRIVGELKSLDRITDPASFLLVFDRNPALFEKSLDLDIPHRVIPRSAVFEFYSAIAQIAGKTGIQVVHAHNLYSAALALSCRWKYGYKVILDYHGRIPEEYVFLGKGGALSRKMLEALERWCVNHSDHVIAVSEKLAEYLIHRYHIPPQKVSTIPCCTDPSIFSWDAFRRQTVRHSMNFGEKVVCTHLGSFSEWYDPDLLLNAYNRISAQTKAHLLIVTGDTQKAVSYLSRKLSPDRFTVRSAEHSEVPGLLNASDIGLLLLRESPNIRTSSPVKFAEYLNCGLPVLISDAVGDYSLMSAQQDVGAIVANDNSFDMNIVSRIRNHRQDVALHCEAVGRHLTWGAFSDKWRRMLSEIR